MESDRARSEHRADTKQMLVWFTGGSWASVYAGLDRQAPHLAELAESGEKADQVAEAVFLHGKLGTL